MLALAALLPLPVGQVEVVVDVASTEPELALSVKFFLAIFSICQHILLSHFGNSPLIR